ncbi:MAG TPA: TlpA disulfide reductase family protein [Pyrinomonadaceae bacterium]|jgi:thiol-disulfide isomerase/thioredoxin
MTNSAPPVTPGKKGFWTPMRLSFTFGVLALTAAFMLPSCQSDAAKLQPNVTVNSNQAPAPPANPAPVSAQPLAASVLSTELKDLDGKTFKLSDYAGKVVIVNLWATWCGPCRVEIPELIKLSDEYKSRGVELIGLTSEDPVQDAGKVKDFVKQQAITYRVGWGNQSFSLGLMQGNVKNVIPQSFVITGDGRVVAHMAGFNPATTPQKLRQAVEQALNFKG